ncbi:esterase/lipase family protein [Glaciecola siphonariae]|uniref:Esterase/lipase family protein n=1 Tax=Glaciecola siphonariae TaxID=521012 RepID=A0ABV9LVG3_9ALTE
MLQNLRVSFAVLCILALSACTSVDFIDLGKDETVNVSPDTKTVIINASSLFSGLSDSDLYKLCVEMPEAAYSQFAAKLMCYQSVLARDNQTATRRELATAALNKLVGVVLSIHQSLPPQEATFGDLQIRLLNNHYGYQHFYQVEKMRSQDPRLPITISGELGVPLVANRPNIGVLADKHYPAEGLFHGVSLVLERVEFGDEAIEIDLRLIDTDKEYVRYAKQKYRARFSPNAAYLVLIENATLDDLRFTGFVNPEAVEARMGIFAITPVDRSKTPLLMIHGLNSDPLIWRHLTNEVLSSPELNHRYQVLHAFYASGTPPFYNAMRLRRELNHYIDYFNITTDEQSLVVIGHSMGGIIGNTMVSDSSYEIWDAAFKLRPDKLTSAYSDQIKEVFVFKPFFDYNQIFFIDTPHRGSATAQSFVGFLGSSLVTLPQNVVALFSGFVQEVGFDNLTERMRPFLGASPANSIEALRPGHPLTDTLSDLPIKGDAFSIIGSNGELACESEFQCMRITDGVVDYVSALHPQSKRRLIVPSRHDSYQHPEAIQFILQSLHEPQSIVREEMVR